MSKTEQKIRSLRAILRKKDLSRWEENDSQPFLGSSDMKITPMEDLIARRDLRIQAEIMLGALVVLEQSPDIIGRFIVAVNQADEQKVECIDAGENGKIIDINNRRNR